MSPAQTEEEAPDQQSAKRACAFSASPRLSCVYTAVPSKRTTGQAHKNQAENTHACVFTEVGRGTSLLAFSHRQVIKDGKGRTLFVHV